MTWLGDNSATALAAGLTGAGSLSAGFREDDWPMDNGVSAVPLQQPTGYPLVPGKLSAGDWVSGAPGLMNKSQVVDALDFHIRVRTILTLPIYDYVTGTGSNVEYHVLDLGRFYIRGHGFVNPNSAESAQYGGKSGWYIDLVYLGAGGQCASLNTGPGAGVDTMALEGQISLYPHFAQVSDATDAPIQYIIVLDVSGSMSWTFDGKGTKNGQVVQCTGTGAVQCPAISPFPDVNQRRIKIASDVLKSFADSVRSQDQVRIVTFSGTFGAYPDPNPPSNSEALNALSHVYPNTWTNVKTTINDAIDAAASFGGTYQTSGETPSSIGLARALQIYQSSNSKDPNTGKTYKRAVIFVTDGMANVTRNGLLNASCGSEDISCQDGEWANDPNTLRPIPAMQAEADNLKALITPESAGAGNIFVVALGNTTLQALQRVSSFVKAANDPATLNSLLDAIRDQVTYGTCVDGAVRTSAVTQIQGSNLPDYSLSSISGLISSPEVGVVTLTGSGGQKYTGKIIWDSGSGLMYYRIVGIPPGQYTLSYWMAYRADVDGSGNPPTRIYSYALPIDGGSVTSDSQAISLQPNADNLGTRNQPIVMDLNPTVDVCSTVTP
jgi:hypothetical protein